MNSRSVRTRLLLIVLTQSCLWSQARLAVIQGAVTDPSGAAIPKAEITASAGPDVVRTTRTDALGRYTLNGLTVGAYTLRATAPGFAPFQIAVPRLAAGSILPINISLTLSSQSEQVTVEAQPAGVVDTDPANNAGAIVLKKADLEALPDDRDDLSADLQALAGPAAGPNGGQIFIYGFTGGRLPSKQSIREIRINQNPFAAQFDRPGQGRIEILTKPGTGEFHGNVLYQFSDAVFNSRNTFVASKPPYRRRQLEWEISGPLGKKTSFFSDFERRNITENAIVNAVILDQSLNVVPFTAAILTPLVNTEINFKVDRQLSSNHNLTARYTYARDSSDNQGVGGFSLAQRAYNVRGSEDTIQLVETGVLSATTVNETRFRFRHQTTNQNGGVAGPTTSVLDAFSNGGSPVGNSFDRQNRYELQNFTTQVRGSHTVRWGGLMRGVSLTNQSMQNYAGSFTFTSLNAYRLTLLGIQNGLTSDQIRASGGGASQFTLSAGNPLAGLNQFDFGFFAQDDWRVLPNLTLSGGLRFETQTHVSDWTSFGPRIGFAWGLDGAKNKAAKSVLRGGFGIFYDRLSESLTLDALRQDGVRQQQFLISDPNFYPAIPSPQSLAGSRQPQTIRETYAQWRPPMMLQLALGFERQISKKLTVATNYVHSIGTHTLRSRNINAPLPGTNVRPYGTVNGIYLYETSGVFRQDQLITNFNVRAGSKLSFSGFYAFGFAHSNTDGAGTFPANQYDLSSEYGRAGFDVRHRLQLNGSWSPKWGLRFSPFITLASGRPFNITTGKDTNGDGLFTDRPAFAPGGGFDLAPPPGAAIIPRNYGSGPGLVAVNLRVGKTFILREPADKKSGDPLQLVFSVNARNILNHPNYAMPDGNLSSPLFGRSTSLISGGGGGGGGGVLGTRRLDLQVRFEF
jgi:Carboxypeptidase regulatory-like domain